MFPALPFIFTGFLRFFGIKSVALVLTRILGMGLAAWIM